MADDGDERVPGSNNPPADETARAAIEASERTKELGEEIARLEADPSSDASPWLSTKAYTTAAQIASDSRADERERHLAEMELQFRVTLHTAWKARQLEQQVAGRADVAARQMSRATWGLVFATSILVLATIGLIVATVTHS